MELTRSLQDTNVSTSITRTLLQNLGHSKLSFSMTFLSSCSSMSFSLRRTSNSSLIGPNPGCQRSEYSTTNWTVRNLLRVLISPRRYHIAIAKTCQYLKLSFKTTRSVYKSVQAWMHEKYQRADKISYRLERV